MEEQTRDWLQLAMYSYEEQKTCANQNVKRALRLLLLSSVARGSVEQYLQVHSLNQQQTADDSIEHYVL